MTSWDRRPPFCRSRVRASPGSRRHAGDALCCVLPGKSECLTQARPALFRGCVELFLIFFVRFFGLFLFVFSGVRLRGEQRGEGRPRRAGAQSGRSLFFSQGEGSWAEELGLVSHEGPAGPAAGRSPPEGVREPLRSARWAGWPAGAAPLRAGKPQRAWEMPGAGSILPRACRPGRGLRARDFGEHLSD